jgi:hypothetical protein
VIGQCRPVKRITTTRVLVISPWNQTVIEAEHNGDHRGYYRLLSGKTLEGFPDAEICCFDVARVNAAAGHVMFVDDEGLYADSQAYFMLGTGGSVFAGRGGIACGGQGEDETGTILSVETVLGSVKWVPIGAQVDPGQLVIEHFDSSEAMLAKLGEVAGNRTPLICSAPFYSNRAVRFRGRPCPEERA